MLQLARARAISVMFMPLRVAHLFLCQQDNLNCAAQDRSGGPLSSMLQSMRSKVNSLDLITLGSALPSNMGSKEEGCGGKASVLHLCQMRGSTVLPRNGSGSTLPSVAVNKGQSQLCTVLGHQHHPRWQPRSGMSFGLW